MTPDPDPPVPDILAAAKRLAPAVRAAPWRHDEALALAPMQAPWRPAGQVRHGFTHFALTIELFAAQVSEVSAEGFLHPVEQLHAAALPSLMRKCAAMAKRPRAGK